MDGKARLTSIELCCHTAHCLSHPIAHFFACFLHGFLAPAARSSDPDAAPHGQLAYYANGRLVASGTQCASRECDMGFPVQQYGVLHLGQEADKPWGDFDELQAFTGLVDEVRVWTSARTDEQILVHAP